MLDILALTPVLARLEKLNSFVQSHRAQVQVYTDIFGNSIDRDLLALLDDAMLGHFDAVTMAAVISDIEVRLYAMQTYQWN